jgi:CRISPR-associated protein Cas2
MDYIICYDITDPKRLSRMHRHLQKHAMPIQYSVFFFNGTERQLETCLEIAVSLIDPDADDLRAYPLPHRGLRARTGTATLPKGIFWSALPSQWQTPERADNG